MELLGCTALTLLKKTSISFAHSTFPSFWCWSLVLKPVIPFINTHTSDLILLKAVLKLPPISLHAPPQHHLKFLLDPLQLKQIPMLKGLLLFIKTMLQVISDLFIREASNS